MIIIIDIIIIMIVLLLGPPVLCCGKVQILQLTKPFSAIRDVFYAAIKQSNFIYNNKTPVIFLSKK